MQPEGEEKSEREQQHTSNGGASYETSAYSCRRPDTTTHSRAVYEALDRSSEALS